MTMEMRMMHSELIANIDNIHTTPLGMVRISRNLSLQDEDIVSWCKAKITDTSSDIVRIGKNYYIRTAFCEITVNAYSYTIITAHLNKKR